MAIYTININPAKTIKILEKKVKLKTSKNKYKIHKIHSIYKYIY